MLLALAILLHPGDKIIWGDTSNCKGIVLDINQSLVHVQGVCYLDNIPFIVNGYISKSDVKKFDKGE